MLDRIVRVETCIYRRRPSFHNGAKKRMITDAQKGRDGAAAEAAGGYRPTIIGTGEEAMTRMTGCMLLLTVALTLATSCDLTAPVPSPVSSSKRVDDNALIKLRTEKNIAEDYVLRAKQFLDASKQERARILYADTSDRYNADMDGLWGCIRASRR